MTEKQDVKIQCIRLASDLFTSDKWCDVLPPTAIEDILGGAKKLYDWVLE